MTKQHELGDAPIQPEYRDMMNWLANAIDKFFNDDKKGLDRSVGFVFMVFPFDSFDGRCNYISNAKRSDVVKLLREQLKRFEEQEDGQNRT